MTDFEKFQFDELLVSEARLRDELGDAKEELKEVRGEVAELEAQVADMRRRGVALFPNGLHWPRMARQVVERLPHGDTAKLVLEQAIYTELMESAKIAAERAARRLIASEAGE